MALTPFGVIVSIQIDGAYEDELVLYAYSVALGTPEESPGQLLTGLGITIHSKMSDDCNINYYPITYNLRLQGFYRDNLNCNWKKNGCSEVG